jgi:CheY-like chemotaxis protein
MNCREFRRRWRAELWERRFPDEFPPPARDHLGRCPSCAALARSDGVTDAALRRLSTAALLPDVQQAWSALCAALDARPRPAAVPAPVRAPRRILAVDDERHVVRLIALNLARAGYDVMTAADGQEALRKVAVEPPDLVVLDVVMPRMDGFAVLHSLKADPRTAQIPVILMSGRAETEDVLRGWQSGVDCFMDKPFNPGKLLLYVQRVFDTREGRGVVGGHAGQGLTGLEH